MPNLLDLMTEEDRVLVKKWAIERKNPKYKQDIPMPLYICAQLGYYYGWDAVMDYRRGYSIGYEPIKDKEGNSTNQLQMVRYAFELEDAVGLIKAAEKVHYRLALDNGRIDAATSVSSNDKKYARANAEYVNRIAKNVI